MAVLAPSQLEPIPRREPREFNLRNARAFAADLYSEVGGYVHYRPLVCSTLARYSGGEVVCCILGEMYEYFMGKPLYTSSATRAVEFVYSTSPGRCSMLPISENEIVRRLTDMAVLKVNRWDSRNALWFDLTELPNVNDKRGVSLVLRAKRCADAVRELAEEHLGNG